MVGQDMVVVEDAAVSDGGRQVLGGVNLSVTPGERVAIIGPSGAGKTTLLRLLAGLLKPAQGRVQTLGHDTSQLSGRRLARLRREVGFLHQQENLIAQLRVVHNVLMGRLGFWCLPSALLSLFWAHAIGLARDATYRLVQADR